MTLDDAKRKLALWEGAVDALASGQSYEVDGLKLTRVKVNEAIAMVKYYRGAVARLSSGRRPGMRVQQIVPRDR